MIATLYKNENEVFFYWIKLNVMIGMLRFFEK